MSNGLLKAQKLAEATSLQFTTGAYGIGFQLGRPHEVRVYPESGQSVIALCNLDSPSASRIGDWLHARMPLE